jgi:uncharacterized protein with HEPN domain
MPRDFEVYLEDMREAIRKIDSYTTGLSREQFAHDDKTVDAVIRNLEIVGEAAEDDPRIRPGRSFGSRMEKDCWLARRPGPPIL